VDGRPVTRPRCAVVTGAGRGLGAALATGLLDRGYRVFGLVRKEEHAVALARQGGVPVRADVASDLVAAALHAALAAETSVDLLVNNAAVIRFGTELSSVRSRDVLESIDVNCVGALRTVQACLPWLRRSPRAVVLNVSSRHGSVALAAAGGTTGVPVSYAYRVSKAALNMLSVAMHEELKEQGVDVVTLHPGRLRGANAPPDADLRADEAARRVLDGVDAGLLTGGRFLHPGARGVTELEW
jgi:NAD(P)-dependent dehydrogenase (short-subunit alcohol dehydrogenase family)